MKKKIEPVQDAKRNNRWRIDVPESIAKATGRKRYKAWFKTRDEAREHVAALMDKKAPSAAIPPILATKADEARTILDEWNLDIVQAAREVAAALKILGGAGTIVEAAEAFRASHDARTASKLLGEAVALYLDARTDLRNATQKSYKYTLEKALAPLHVKMMADITTAELNRILSPKAATARAMHKRNLRVFWKWASILPRQWATMATVDALEVIRVSSDADIEILSVADVKSLLRAAEAEGNAAAAAYAIAVFGGIRMAELGRLTWGDVGTDHIEIGKSVAKKHSRRFIPVCPTLRAWMSATRGDAEKSAGIVPPNWTDVSKSVRRRAGWNVAARLLADPQEPTRGEWPSNACRHTCASVQVAIGTPLDDLTFKFGHSGGHDLLRKHYVSRLTKKDALAILSIGPRGRKITKLNLPNKQHGRQ
jgi:integrase